MGRLAAITASLLALGLLVVFPLAYASARSDEIAEGVTVSGIDLGGRTADEARAILRERLRAPARRDLVVRHPDESFTLTADDAGLRVDVEAAVQQALDRSDGSPWSRTWRGVFGGTVDADIEAPLEIDEEAVGAFVKRVADDLDHRPQSADIDPRDGTLKVISADEGFRTDREKLLARVEGALRDPGSAEEIEAPGEVLEPATTDAELKEGIPVYLIVDRDDFKLRLYEDLEKTEVYRIGVGQAGHETPSGSYEISTKQVDPTWYVPDKPWAGELRGETIPPDDPRNPLEERWLGIARGVGIHGTDDRGSIGRRSSHGCIRMLPEQVIELYEDIPVGTPVYIA